MGLRKMVSRIPALRYIQDVKRGSEAQRERALESYQRAIPLVTDLRNAYERNHVSDLVDKTFFGRT